jgi:homogentisate 1,2-dioxygenase
MIDRRAAGRLPPKPHTVFRDPAGALLHEECLTRDGFEGPYTILYHRHRPHTAVHAAVAHGWQLPVAAPPRPLAKRHYRSADAARARPGGPPCDARVPLLFNDDVVLSVLFPDAPDPVYVSNGDGDDLFYVFSGGGTLRSPFGDLAFHEGDYLFVPRGVPHRLMPAAATPQHWLGIECLGGLRVPRQFRNEAGQLRMDAPYTHRDFRAPVLGEPGAAAGGGPDDGVRQLLVKRAGAFHGFALEHTPLDVVGWDGTVYPWAFPILAFQPRAGQVHLPPTWHGTFSARGALICSFVPRALDFHPDAIPCPYPHSSVDCDEFIFYCRGNFTSRRGVGPGGVSHHPAGVPHGPHPGAYEASIGVRWTDELAVMLDTWKPLHATAAAVAVEDPGYEASFVG